MVYFGCWNEAGHFLWNKGWRRLRRHDREKLNIPREETLDCSPLLLPLPERVGIGVLTYLPAPNMTVLAWWGSKFDDRGKVNCAVIANSNMTLDELWNKFKQEFPDPNNYIMKPTLCFNL